MSADDEIRIDAMPEAAKSLIDFSKVAQLVGDAVRAVDHEINSEILEAIVADNCIG